MVTPKKGQQGKLHANSVHAIRRRCARGESAIELGKQYNLTAETIRRVARGELYRHIVTDMQGLTIPPPKRCGARPRTFGLMRGQ